MNVQDTPSYTLDDVCVCVCVCECVCVCVCVCVRECVVLFAS